MSKLRIMSQNQWNCTDNLPFWKERGLDCSSAHRMKGHKRVFMDLLPDIVGGQEINKEMQADLIFNLLSEGLNYTLVWGNMTPILYRSDRLELLANEFFAYPEKIEGLPEEYNDVKSKAVNLGVFRDKESGEVFVFATTHLWWMSDDPTDECYREGSESARLYQIGMLIDCIEKYQRLYNNCPAFLVGDLNCNYDSPTVRYAMEKRGFLHAHNIATDYANEENGHHCCYGNREVLDWPHRPFREAIDHILVRDFKGAVRRFDRYTPDYYLYLSDHAPVYIDIELGE